MRCSQPLLTKRIVHVVCVVAVRRQRRLLTHTRTGNARDALCSSRIHRCGHQSQSIRCPRVLAGEHSRELVRLSTTLARASRRIRNLGMWRRLSLRAAMPTATESGCSRRRIGRPSHSRGLWEVLDMATAGQQEFERTRTTRCARVRCLRCGVRRHTSCLGAVPRRCREIEFDAHSSAVSVVTLRGTLVRNPQARRGCWPSPATDVRIQLKRRAVPSLRIPCASSSQHIGESALSIQMIRCLQWAR